MPTLTSSRSHGLESASMPTATTPPRAPTLSSFVAQMTDTRAARSRLRSSLSSTSPSSANGDATEGYEDALEIVDDDDIGNDGRNSAANTAAGAGPTPSPLRRMPSAAARAGLSPFQLVPPAFYPSSEISQQHPQSHHQCDSCGELEAEFAAAVLFVDSYAGPHRILRQEHSAPKKEFYALYQQATIGPCPSPTPPSSATEGGVGPASKLDIARWEKWRQLGAMTRQEAMRRYTTALDNLVDDWRRSAGLSKPPTTTIVTDQGTSPSPTTLQQHSLARTSGQRPMSIFERLPRIYDEFGELQERVDDESRRREELEAQLVAFTRDHRALLSREMRQVDHMRTSLTALVKSLEEDVTLHHNELQAAIQRQRELRILIETSGLLAIEARVRQVYGFLRAWLRHKVVWRLIVALAVLRVWVFVRQRRLPQFLAQFLIRVIASASSLPTTETSNRLTTSSAGG